MTYRPYPSVDRALRQLDRHVQPGPVRPPKELQLQAMAAMSAAAEVMRPIKERMVRAVANVQAPQLDFSGLHVQLDKVCAESAPGALTLHRALQGMRRPA